jgi:hypothetical protein
VREAELGECMLGMKTMNPACGFSAHTSVARGGHVKGRIRTDPTLQDVDHVVDGAVGQRMEAGVVGWRGAQDRRAGVRTAWLTPGAVLAHARVRTCSS